jgi:hypothetical protein
MTKVAAEASRPDSGGLLGYSRRRTTRAVPLPAGPDRSGSWLCRSGIFLLPPPEACLTRMRTFLINVPGINGDRARSHPQHQPNVGKALIPINLQAGDSSTLSPVVSGVARTTAWCCASSCSRQS